MSCSLLPVRILPVPKAHPRGCVFVTSPPPVFDDPRGELPGFTHLIAVGSRGGGSSCTGPAHRWGPSSLSPKSPQVVWGGQMLPSFPRSKVMCFAGDSFCRRCCSIPARQQPCHIPLQGWGCHPGAVLPGCARRAAGHEEPPASHCQHEATGCQGQRPACPELCHRCVAPCPLLSQDLTAQIPPFAPGFQGCSLPAARNALVVLAAGLVAYSFQLSGSQPLTLTGSVPRGLPPFRPPPFSKAVPNGTVPFGRMVQVGAGLWGCFVGTSGLRVAPLF